MFFYLIFYIILNMLLLGSIIWDLVRRNRLGNLLMKVRLDFQMIMGLLIYILSGLAVVFFVSRYSKDTNDFYVDLTANISYFLVIIQGCVRILTSREIREKGITLFRGSFFYYDFNNFEWLSENKLEMKFEGNVFNRQFKEKWKIDDWQTDELKQHIKERYHDNF